MVSSLLESWHGGWSLGSRYMIPAIPFLVILAAGLATTIGLDESTAERAPRRRWVERGAQLACLALISYSALLMLAGTAVRPEVPQHIKRPFGSYLMPHFYAGQLALNPQHINQPNSPPNGEPQARNLGQLLGLEGLASLIPLALAMAAIALWLVWAARRQRALSQGPRGPPEPATPDAA